MSATLFSSLARKVGHDCSAPSALAHEAWARAYLRIIERKLGGHKACAVAVRDHTTTSMGEIPTLGQVINRLDKLVERGLLDKEDRFYRLTAAGEAAAR